MSNNIRVKIVLAMVVGMGLPVVASSCEMGSDSGESTNERDTHESMDHGDEGMQGDKHAMDMAGHQHGEWVAPPADYSEKVNADWNDEAAALRGKTLYQQNCASCHGADGKGTGPVAKSLEHPPADLTNHFHKKAGDGDAYLFWRVSEGGVVAPFKAMKSGMPPFKSSLSEPQRWDVLTYVHKAFHKGFSDEDKRDDSHKDHTH